MVGLPIVRVELKMTDAKVQFPRCGILMPEDFETPQALWEAKKRLANELHEEMTKLFDSHYLVEELVSALNRLFAPFNVYDHLVGIRDFVIATPSEWLESARNRNGLQLRYFASAGFDLQELCDHVEIAYNGSHWHLSYILDGDVVVAEEERRFRPYLECDEEGMEQFEDYLDSIGVEYFFAPDDVRYWDQFERYYESRGREVSMAADHHEGHRVLAKYCLEMAPWEILDSITG